jgi:MFS family permease
MLVPVTTIVAGQLSNAPMGLIAGVTVTPQLLAVAVACIFVGAAMSGCPLGCNAMLLEMLPERGTSVFIGFYFLMLLPTSAVPLIGSVIIGAQDRFVLGMALAGLAAILMLLQIRRLEPVREEVENPPDA